MCKEVCAFGHAVKTGKEKKKRKKKKNTKSLVVYV